MVERKDAFIKTKTGHASGKPAKVEAKTASQVLALELSRHFSGITNAIVKWAKTVEKQKQTNTPKHIVQFPSARTAPEQKGESLDK